MNQKCTKEIYIEGNGSKHFLITSINHNTTEATLTFECTTEKAEMKGDTEWLYLNYPPVNTEYFHLLGKKKTQIEHKTYFEKLLLQKKWRKNETPVKASSQDTPLSVTRNQCGSKSTNTDTEGTQSEWKFSPLRKHYLMKKYVAGKVKFHEILTLILLQHHSPAILQQQNSGVWAYSITDRAVVLVAKLCTACVQGRSSIWLLYCVSFAVCP